MISITAKNAQLLLGAALVCAFSLTACGTANKVQTTQATPQGTIALDMVKVGMPESTFKDAILTFVTDPSPMATAGGRTQYLSRTRDANGGQYVVSCRGGQCNSIMVMHQEHPISNDAALKTLQSLFPADAPSQPKVDATGLTGTIPVENVTFSNAYKGQLICADKAGSQVKIIAAKMESGATQ